MSANVETIGTRLIFPERWTESETVEPGGDSQGCKVMLNCSEKKTMVLVEEGRRRVQFESVWPEIDGGRFPIKRIAGDTVRVDLAMFSDGHDAIAGALLYRHESSTTWSEVPLWDDGYDQWHGEFTVSQLGRYLYTVTGWVDHFSSWRHGMFKKVEAEQDVTVDLLIGAELVAAAAERATGADAQQLQQWANRLRTQEAQNLEQIQESILADELASLMAKYPDRRFASTYEKELKVVVERERAQFSSWYELFPRSCGQGGKHGTFQDCIQQLPYIAEMGFDVLYLPPIHPIGYQFRKGKNNTLVPAPDDVGVPWAIGNADGGHKAIHPELGTLADFRELVAKAQTYGIEIALDLAYQCSPDHPYVKDHPEWFKKRPDGTIQYAENPPKKYQDIYPIDFESSDWENLWIELKSVIEYWVEQGVKIFRVDNPHTKSFDFWEWVIATTQAKYPDLIFLSESFTRPRVMYRLGKLGFTQSYTYFTWRNNKWEMTEYLHELTQTPVREFFRPNFWPNTPDILHAFLQEGGRPAFMIRVVLAATLTASYGIYGPAYEVCENRPIKPGSEEYLDSEKYQLREWDLNSPYSIKDLIAKLNRTRHQNQCLKNNDSLRFHSVDNDQIICYSKQTSDRSEVILCIVSFDPHETQVGYVDLPLEFLGINPYHSYQVYDVLTDSEYEWFGGHCYVALHPHGIPAHVFRVKQGVP